MVTAHTRAWQSLQSEISAVGQYDFTNQRDIVQDILSQERVF